MDFHTAALTIRTTAVTIMVISLSLRTSKIMCTDGLLIAVALGMAMLASAAVLAGQYTACAWLFTAHVMFVFALQSIYGLLPLHPLRAYRKMRGHR